MENNERAENIKKMEQWLKASCPDCVLIPAYQPKCAEGSLVKPSKQPITSHKDKTTEQLWAEWHDRWRDRVLSSDLTDVLIILRAGLIVIDVDDAALADRLEEMFCSMRTTAIQKTRKGRHYFFQRSPACDELPLYDKSQGLVDEDGCTLPIDIKTVCSTNTGGLISIYPSQNKVWLRAPYDYPPIMIPDDLFHWIKTHRKSNGDEKKGVGLGSSSSSGRGCRHAGSDEVESVRSISSLASSFSTFSRSSSLRSCKPTYTFEIEPDALRDLVLVCLAPSRADDYGDWITVGMALKHTSDTNFALWVEFSKRSDKFKSVEECAAKWSSFDTGCLGPRGPLTVASIIAMAKNDSPEAHAQVMENTLGRLVLNSVTKSDVGRVAHRLYGKTHVCVAVPSKHWYAFQGHRWVLEVGGSSMWRRLRDDLPGVYLSMATQQQLLANSSSEEDRKPILQTVKRMNTIAANLGDTQFKEAILRESAHFMNVDAKSFQESLDTQCSLLGFANGVYDLDRGVFRDGSVDDRITMSCGYAFAEQDDPAIQEDIRAFVQSTQASPAMAEYMWLTLAYLLHGQKYLELMWFWTGKRGRNGKSTLVALLSYALGDYFYAPDAGIFMSSLSDKNTAGARPEIAKMRGKRLVIASEPDDVGSSFKVNKLKGWRGNDMISARALYQDTASFRPQFGIIISMNDKPSLDKIDNAIAQTLRIIDFPHEFVSAPTEPHQRPIDTTLKARFERLAYRQQFMRMLIKVYRDNYSSIFGVGAQIPTPGEVSESTQQYMDENDPVGDWLHGYYERTSNPKDLVTFMELFNAFKSDTNAMGFKQKMFSSALETHLGAHSSLNGKKVYRRLRRKPEDVSDDLE